MRHLFLCVLLTSCTTTPTLIDGRFDAGPDASQFDAATTPDAAMSDAATTPDAFTTPDANDGCTVNGITGHCMPTASCAAMTGYQSTAGHCPGAADIQCCTPTPDLSMNPAVPAGYRLMTDAEVTPAMTAWAVAILHDDTTYPMFSTAMMTFGTQPVLARVEWHPPDFNNMTVHRGVTLYVPIG